MAAEVSVAAFLTDIREKMRLAADAEFAEGASRFFKCEVDLWGVRTVDVQRIVRDVYGTVKHWPVPQRNRLCTELWKGKFEEGVLVSHLYRRFAKTCSRCEWKLFEQWIDRYVRNWAHCDGVSSWLLAACIANEPELKRELPAWTTSKNRWKRRASAVALLQEAKRGRCTGQILEIAQLLRDDPDDMVQKGVGWLLKESYPKQPDAVVAFLSEVQFPRLVMRYAAEKMTAVDRKTIGLNARASSASRS